MGNMFVVNRIGCRIVEQTKKSTVYMAAAFERVHILFQDSKIPCSYTINQENQ